ncbi:hypothetical protein EV178_003589 [Coemansia sp. RSA 1646]|nr:hypothetical protein EV178_003589 [Coemansia sp. RSA 1646]
MQRERAQSSSSDCVYCQKLTQNNMDEDKGINTQELYNRIKTGRWSMADADDWRLFSLSGGSAATR